MHPATSVKPCKPGVHQQASWDNLWPQTQAGLWILLAVFVGFYGNGKHDVITVARQHPDVWRYMAAVLTHVPALHSLDPPVGVTCRKAYYVGVAGVGVNIGVFLYLAFW